MMFSFKNIAMYGVLGFALSGFVGCGDDSSTSASQNDVSISSANQVPISSTISSSSDPSLESSSAVEEIVYGELTDERDNHVYKTVVIGTQTWMAENLNYADSVKTPSLKGRNWCYSNSEDKCKTYGRYYTWSAAIDSMDVLEKFSKSCGYRDTCERFSPSVVLANPVRGICPDGWHIPSVAEWNLLIKSRGGEVKAGKVLKSATDWNGTNASGFSAISVGNYKQGFFNPPGVDASFWSSGEVKDRFANNAYVMYLFDDGDLAKIDEAIKNVGLSVRCIKD